MSVLPGNETMPVVITCNVTCLNRTDTGHYTPALSFVVTELEMYEEFQGTPGTNEDLYRVIEYIRPASLCSDTNNWTMQYSYRIYPTINMNQTVVRCGVHYFYYMELCWGEPVVVIRYTSINNGSPVICTTTTDMMTTTDVVNSTDPVLGTINTTENNDTTTTRSSTVEVGGQSDLIAGASSGSVITVIVVAIVALLLVVFGYKYYNSRKKHKVHACTTSDSHSTASSTH